MSRPKKGEKGHKEAVKKWRATMIEKYGSEEALHEAIAEMGRKGGEASHNGGFASNKVGKDGLTGRQRAALVGAIGGFRSKRKKKEEK